MAAAKPSKTGVSSDATVPIVENKPSVVVEPKTDDVHIRFKRHFSGYNPDEVANFPAMDAARFIALGVADEVVSDDE